MKDMRTMIQSVESLFQENTPDFSNLPKPPLDVVVGAHLRAMDRLYAKLVAEHPELGDSRIWGTIQSMHQEIKNSLEKE